MRRIVRRYKGLFIVRHPKRVQQRERVKKYEVQINLDEPWFDTETETQRCNFDTLREAKAFLDQ